MTVIGMSLWSLINFTFAFKQYELHGEITPSMVVSLLLQTCYIADFFWLQTWYLFTIDIALDHFGWYLCWGIMCFLPCTYVFVDCSCSHLVATRFKLASW